MRFLKNSAICNYYALLLFSLMIYHEHPSVPLNINLQYYFSTCENHIIWRHHSESNLFPVLRVFRERVVLTVVKSIVKKNLIFFTNNLITYIVIYNKWLYSRYTSFWSPFQCALQVESSSPHYIFVPKSKFTTREREPWGPTTFSELKRKKNMNKQESRLKNVFWTNPLPWQLWLKTLP